MKNNNVLKFPHKSYDEKTLYYKLNFKKIVIPFSYFREKNNTDETLHYPRENFFDKDLPI